MASGTCRLMSKYCSSIGVSLAGRDIANGSVYRLSNAEQMTVFRVEFDDDRVVQRGVRNAVAEHQPARAVAARIGDVNHLVALELRALSEDVQRDVRRVVAQNPSMPPRRIVGTAQRDERDRADRNPRRVEPQEP